MAFDFPFVKEALTQLFQKSSCEQYPAKPKVAYDGYRGRIVFYPEKCINCNLCERVCAGGAIQNKVMETTEEGDYIERSFFLGSCTFCGFCQDFCSEKAIELSKDFAMTATDPEELVVRGIYFRKKRPRPAPKAAGAKAPVAGAKAPAAAPAEAKAPAAPAPAEDDAPACSSQE